MRLPLPVAAAGDAFGLHPEGSCAVRVGGGIENAGALARPDDVGSRALPHQPWRFQLDAVRLGTHRYLYILSEWDPWEPALTGLREALDELGLLEEAEKLDLRRPVPDYFNPLFSTGWTLARLDTRDDPPSMDGRR
jgi:hypothetical protein